jgi:hypothetical protein
MLTQFYIELADRVKATLPNLKRVTLWNDDLADPANQHLVVPPSAFIQFGTISWQDFGIGVQLGTFEVTVILVERQLGEAEQGSLTQDIALSGLRRIEELHLGLQGWGGTWHTPLSRVATDVDQARGTWSAHTVTYSTSLSDASADPLCQLTEVLLPPPDITRDVDDAPPDASQD